MSAVQSLLKSSLTGGGVALLTSSVTLPLLSGPADSVIRTQFAAKVGLGLQLASISALTVASLVGRTNVVSFINNLNTIAGLVGVAIKACTTGCNILFKEEKVEWKKLAKETVIDLAAFAGLAILGAASNAFAKKL